MSVVNARAVRTQRFLDGLTVDFDHRFLEGEVACPWPGPCLICRWYTQAFLDSLGGAP